MKLVKPSVEYYGPVPTDYNEALRFIEIAGRTCYKSEDKITYGSAEKFARKLTSAKPYPHLAMVEHSNFVIQSESDHGFHKLAAKLGKYLNIQYDFCKDITYIGGSLTAWYNQGLYSNWLDDFYRPFLNTYGDLFDVKILHKFASNNPWYKCSDAEIPNVLHRYSMKFICDRGVSHELVRHRPCSFAQVSTRYVDYKDGPIEFVEPWWFALSRNNIANNRFKLACQVSEDFYKQMRETKFTPQASRTVLINALKTEVVVTADVEEWIHIRKLRTELSAHPDMIRIMSMVPWHEFLQKS